MTDTPTTPTPEDTYDTLTDQERADLFQQDFAALLDKHRVDFRPGVQINLGFFSKADWQTRKDQQLAAAIKRAVDVQDEHADAVAKKKAELSGDTPTA